LNESDDHAGPPGRETHFRVIIVSEAFIGVNRVRRSQMVYDLLATELKSGVHALGLQTLTPEEWSRTGKVIESPGCSQQDD